MTAHDPNAPFTGTQRFELVGQLGTGSMCVVYEARDRKHGDIVALKTLRHLDSHSLYRLKQEFRALSHFDHPNLVSFSELVYSEQGWFVTMERVQGIDFLTFCRGHEPERVDAHTSTQGSTWATHTDLAMGEDETDYEDHGANDKRPLPDMVRLRSCMRQLAEGVQTLHAAGRVHRDLKPSNVLVTEAGRVVILDFGLVAEIDQDYTEGTLHQNIAGSAAYMSPEQSVGRPLSESSDWYSVGVMLYESLCGRWPYTGHLYQILTLKQEEDPPPPSRFTDNVPEDLERLAMALLHRDPTQRPSGPEVLAAFQSRRTSSKGGPIRAPFRFREPHVQQLTSAYQHARKGQPAVMLVRGAKSSGKTVLVREFVKLVKRHDPGVMILKSRCFEWETVPYKAIDGLMDNLSRALRRADHRQIHQLANPGLPYLAHLFPVLARVDAFGLTPPADLDRLDPGALKQRAFEGLFVLLKQISTQTPLLLFLDDAHWGDADSASVLGQILSFAKDIPICIILAYRTETQSPFIGRLVPKLQEARVAMQSLDLVPFSPSQTTQLAAEMLQADPTDERVQAVLESSGGLPGLIVEHVHQQTFQDDRANTEDTLSAITVAAINALPGNARHLLNVLAVCDHPLADAVALFAAALETDAFEALSTLRAHDLLRVTGAKGGDSLELVSERVREYVLDRIPEDWRVSYHQRLAHALEQQGENGEVLVQHYLGGHQNQKAGVVAWLAADEAEKAGRDQQVIRLLELAHQYGTWTPVEQRTISSKLAKALAKAGAGRRAAALFEQAAEDAAVERKRELLHRAADQYIGCGDLERGTALLDQLMDEVGVHVGSGKGWFGGGLQRMRRMRLKWRGVDFTTQPEREIPLTELLKVDLCWTRAMGLGLVDANTGATAQTTHLQLALETGEPERALRALAAEVRFLAWRRDAEWKERFQHVLEQSKSISSRQALARATSAAASAHLMEGTWQQAGTFAKSAGQMFLHHGIGSAWERLSCRWVACRAALGMGDLKLARSLARPLIRDVRGADNQLFQAFVAAGIQPLLAMADDAPDPVLRSLADIPPHLGSEVGVPFFHLLNAWCTLELYKSRPQKAKELLDGRWDAVVRNLDTAPPELQAELHLTHARVLVASGAAVRDVDPSLTAVRALGLPWADAWADLVQGRLHRASDPKLTDRFKSTGQILGAALAQTAMGNPPAPWFAEQSVRRPEQLLEALAPAR